MASMILILWLIAISTVLIMLVVGFLQRIYGLYASALAQLYSMRLVFHYLEKQFNDIYYTKYRLVLGIYSLVCYGQNRANADTTIVQCFTRQLSLTMVIRIILNFFFCKKTQVL